VRNEGNRHHVLFPRKLHEAHPDTKSLRRKQLLIPNLIVVGHIALHNAVAFVPPLDRHMASRVNRDFIPVRDNHIASMQALTESIERCAEHPRAGEIEIANAEIAVRAIQMQIPFVKEYLVRE